MTILTTCNHCGSALIRKHEMSAYFCDRTCKGEWQKRHNKPVTEEWLRDAYLVKGLDCTDIARIVGRDSKSVWNWLKGFGIQTRPRGSSPKTQLTTGDPRSFAGTKHSEASKEKIRQARLRDGGVPYLKNGVHHLKGKRGAETPNWRGGVTPERQSFYSSQEWSEAVKAVWHRDDAKCQRCGMDHRNIDRTKTKFHVHHIVSFAVRELRSEVSNLVLLCDGCHRWVHSKKNTNKEMIG